MIVDKKRKNEICRYIASGVDIKPRLERDPEFLMTKTVKVFYTKTIPFVAWFFSLMEKKYNISVTKHDFDDEINKIHQHFMRDA